MFKLFLILFSLCLVAIYFVPSFIAINRRHSHLLQITILNAFLGWSFIAWVAALIWATTNNTEQSTPTKGAWITIGVIALIFISPVFLYSVMPTKYKTGVIQESHYKKTIYTKKDGKIIKEVIETKELVDED